VLENRRDPEATAKAKFHSVKSFISFRGHVYLYGLQDHLNMRQRIYERAKGMCQVCPKPHFVDWDAGHWHHAQKTFGGKRCDGLCCGVWACAGGHVKEHGRTIHWSDR